MPEDTSMVTRLWSKRCSALSQCARPLPCPQSFQESLHNLGETGDNQAVVTKPLNGSAFPFPYSMARSPEKQNPPGFWGK